MISLAGRLSVQGETGVYLLSCSSTYRVGTEKVLSNGPEAHVDPTQAM